MLCKCYINDMIHSVDSFVGKQTVFAILQFTEISRKLRDDKDEEGEGQGDTVVTKVPLKNSTNALLVNLLRKSNKMF